MVGSNLPPGTTTGDIDKHFGAPETETVRLEAVVDVHSRERLDDPRDMVDVSFRGEWCDIVHGELVETTDDGFIYTVYLGLVFQSQYQAMTDLSRQARKMLAVGSEDNRVTEVQYIEMRGV